MTLDQSLNLSVLRQRKAASCPSHTGVQRHKEKTGPSPPSWILLFPLGPGRGAGSVIQSLKKKDPPPPPHGLGDPFLLPPATLRCDLKCGKQNKASPWTDVSHLSAV